MFQHTVYVKRDWLRHWKISGWIWTDLALHQGEWL